LDQAVEDLDGLLLANFYVGPRQFDFVLVLPEYTVLIELKSLAGAAFGVRTATGRFAISLERRENIQDYQAPRVLPTERTGRA
jgi:hypothetical protein